MLYRGCWKETVFTSVVYDYLQINYYHRGDCDNEEDMSDFFRSFMYAMNGIRASIGAQRNLKVQSSIALGVTAAGFYFDITGTEWCLILLAIGLVISLELMNSAIESLVDLVTLERKPLAGKVKDIAAGAVLFASMIAVIMGVIIFGKYIYP